MQNSKTEYLDEIHAVTLFILSNSWMEVSELSKCLYNMIGKTFKITQKHIYHSLFFLYIRENGLKIKQVDKAKKQGIWYLKKAQLLIHNENSPLIINDFFDKLPILKKCISHSLSLNNQGNSNTLNAINISTNTTHIWENEDNILEQMNQNIENKYYTREEAKLDLFYKNKMNM